MFRLGFLDLGLDLDLGFSMLLLAIVVQPSAHLSCVTCSRWTNKFSKVKVPWPTYSHCLETT